MKRVVFDTNVLVSAIIFSGNERKILQSVESGQIQLVISRAIVSELFGVLRRKFHFTEAEVRRVEELLLSIAELVEPRETLKVVTDGPDNRILECAVEGGTEAIITGDRRHLLPLKSFRGIKILEAKSFLGLKSNIKLT